MQIRSSCRAFCSDRRIWCRIHHCSHGRWAHWEEDNLYRLYWHPSTIWTCVSLAHKTEQFLQLDLAIIRQAYEWRHITGTIWMSGTIEPVDGLTRVDRRIEALDFPISTNHFMPQAGISAQRDHTQVKTISNGHSIGSSPFENNVGGLLSKKVFIRQGNTVMNHRVDVEQKHSSSRRAAEPRSRQGPLQATMFRPYTEIVLYVHCTLIKVEWTQFYWP